MRSPFLASVSSSGSFSHSEKSTMSGASVKYDRSVWLGAPTLSFQEAVVPGRVKRTGVGSSTPSGGAHVYTHAPAAPGASSHWRPGTINSALGHRGSG